MWLTPERESTREKIFFVYGLRMLTISANSIPLLRSFVSFYQLNCFYAWSEKAKKQVSFFFSSRKEFWRKGYRKTNIAIQTSQGFVKSQRPMAIKCLIKCLCETWDSRENTERMITQEQRELC
ncbi:unnamed protein product [Coffea canephora]|uniref:Uncharacterized protein n=1 Tax=Coffea canephora TaxID=49390 RepID=A0A068UBB1_COFCA|nr:unnamed protein product [Coffea canephora]